jgi:hypothetical protein
MKRLGSVAMVSLLALVGCDNTSRLTNSTKPLPKSDTPPAEAAPPAPAKADHTGTLEERVARLEDSMAKYAPTIEWVAAIRQQQEQQQKAQQEQQRRSEPDPAGVFAVDITPDLKLGQVEGSPQALVTIVEAWDFA